MAPLADAEGRFAPPPGAGRGGTAQCGVEVLQELRVAFKALAGSVRVWCGGT